MNQLDYHFFEWLVISKNMDSEQYEKLSEDEIKKLKSEFVKEYNNALKIKV